MRAATNLAAIALAAAALGACQSEEPAEQNITIDNGIDPDAEIETLPADEGGTEPPADEPANSN